MTPVVDIFRQIVTDMATYKGCTDTPLLQRLQLANSTIDSISYEFGHPLELIQTMAERAKNPSRNDKMWPVVMLFTDFPEVMTRKPVAYNADITLQLVIAMITSADLKAANRLERNFKPILYPIYEALMYQIDRSAAFVTYSSKQIPHTKWDRYYWGKTGLYGNTGNTFNDWIDAIEIQNMQLKINY